MYPHGFDIFLVPLSTAFLSTYVVILIVSYSWIPVELLLYFIA